MPTSSPKKSKSKPPLKTKRKSTTPKKPKGNSLTRVQKRLSLPEDTDSVGTDSTPRIGPATRQWMDPVIDRSFTKWLDSWAKRGVPRTHLEELLDHLLSLKCTKNWRVATNPKRGDKEVVLDAAARQAQKAEHYQKYHPLIRLALAEAYESRQTALRRGCAAAIQKIVGYQPNDRARRSDPSKNWLKLLRKVEPQLQHWWHQTPKTAKKSAGKAITLLAKSLTGDAVGDNAPERVGLLQVIHRVYSKGHDRMTSVEAQSRISVDGKELPLRPTHSRAVLIASGEIRATGTTEARDLNSKNKQDKQFAQSSESLRSKRRDIKALRTNR